MMKLEYVKANKNIIRASQEHQRDLFEEAEKNSGVTHRLIKQRGEHRSPSNQIERKTLGSMYQKQPSDFPQRMLSGEDASLKNSAVIVANKKEYVSEANIPDASLQQILHSRPLTLESKQPRNIMSAISDPKSRLTKTTNFTRK
jgi:hypothetical protein